MKKVVVGGQHTLFLRSDERVYVAGLSTYGQLIKENIVPTITLEDELSNMEITEIATGMYHTLVATKSLGVFSFGFGKYGQLGVADSSSLPRIREVFPSFS